MKLKIVIAALEDELKKWREVRVDLEDEVRKLRAARKRYEEHYYEARYGNVHRLPRDGHGDIIPPEAFDGDTPNRTLEEIRANYTPEANARFDEMIDKYYARAGKRRRLH